MQQKMSLLVGSSVIAGVLLMGGTAFAQTTASTGAAQWQRGGTGMMKRAPGVFGTVTAINGSTITVTSKAPMRRGAGTSTTAGTETTYTIDASNATVTKAGATSSLSNIAVGDTIMAAGTVSGTSVTATSIRDGVMMGARGNFAGHASTTAATIKETAALVQGNGQPVIGGAVTAVSGNTLTITNKSNVTYTVDVTSAKIVKVGATSTLSNIAIGDNVLVQGAVNGSSVSASSVIDQGVIPTTSNATTNPPATSHGFMGAIGGFFHKLFGFF